MVGVPRYGVAMPNSATRIHLFRHGQVTQAWQGMIYGRLDVPLSETGLEQARWAASSLEDVALGAVISSGLQRAETSAAQLRQGRDLPRRDEPDLLEIDRGSWAGLSPQQVNRNNPGGFEAWKASGGLLTPPGGETVQVMAMRVSTCLLSLAEEYAGSTIAIVAHLWVLRIALCMGLSRPWQDTPRMQVGPGVRTDFEWTPGVGLRFLGVEAPEGSEVKLG